MRVSRKKEGIRKKRTKKMLIPPSTREAVSSGAMFPTAGKLFRRRGRVKRKIPPLPPTHRVRGGRVEKQRHTKKEHKSTLQGERMYLLLQAQTANFVKSERGKEGARRKVQKGKKVLASNSWCCHFVALVSVLPLLLVRQVCSEKGVESSLSWLIILVFVIIISSPLLTCFCCFP